MAERRSLTREAHQALRDIIQPGDHVIDATAGNGYDTLFLAQAAGASGHVYAFDIQAEAIASTRARLNGVGLLERATLIHTGHEKMLSHIPEDQHGNIAACTFNLGYLPGSDKTVITQAHTTLDSLHQANQLLRTGGRISLLIYRGHAGGQQEFREIVQGLLNMSGLRVGDQATERTGPVLLVLEKTVSGCVLI